VIQTEEKATLGWDVVSAGEAGREKSKGEVVPGYLLACMAQLG
jgi:hypothetical protein